MSEQASKRKVPIKADCQYLIRAKLYGVITLNSLEGMMRELDGLIPVDIEKDNVDVFADELRRYQDGALLPTGHGDYLDRAMKSLAKEWDIQVPIELSNSNAVRALAVRLILSSSGDERHQYLDLLQQPIEMIMKSVRFEQLVNQVCIMFYKKPASNISEDTISFIRRSIHELFRSKWKEQLQAQLISTQPLTQRPFDGIMSPYEYIDNGQYISGQIIDSERMMSNDMLQGLRQSTDKDMEMISQPGSMKTENITLYFVC